MFVQLNQKFALTLLAKMGHSVVLAENGQLAVDKWRATLSSDAFTATGSSTLNDVPLVVCPTFDICLMDLAMPVCDYFTRPMKVFY